MKGQGNQQDENKKNIKQNKNVSEYPLSKELLNSMMTCTNSTSSSLVQTLFKVVQEQSFALQALVTKLSLISQKTDKLTSKIQHLKRNSSYTVNEIPNKIQDPGFKVQDKTSHQMDSSILMNIVFGRQEYDYKLQLTQPIELPLYRERNFSISLRLKDVYGNSISNENKIPLSLAIYSCENPPKFLEANTVGQKMVKGFTQKSLHFGFCHFSKIQIREVTSHFRNGWVFIVIIPLMTPLGVNCDMDNYIDYRKIQPLVIDKIVVKAKKIKDNKEKEEDKQKKIEKEKDQSTKREKISQNKSSQNEIKFEDNKESGSFFSL